MEKHISTKNTLHKKIIISLSTKKKSDIVCFYIKPQLYIKGKINLTTLN